MIGNDNLRSQSCRRGDGMGFSRAAQPSVVETSRRTEPSRRTGPYAWFSSGGRSLSGNLEGNEDQSGELPTDRAGGGGGDTSDGTISQILLLLCHSADPLPSRPRRIPLPLSPTLDLGGISRPSAAEGG